MTQTLQAVAQVKSMVADFISSKNPDMMKQVPTLCSASLDNVSKGYSLLEKVKSAHLDSARDKDQLQYTINSQKLEMAKLSDYDIELAQENYELVKRLGLFEEEIRDLELKATKAEEMREAALNNYDQVSSILVEKSKDIEMLKKEKADLNTYCKGLQQNLKLLEDLADNQNEDLKKDRELYTSLETANKQLAIYKDNFLEKKVQAEKLELELNSLDSQLKTVKIDLANEQTFTRSLKKELKDLKDKISELETMKKEYINGLGVSKLGISTLNFSKLFQHDAGGVGAPHANFTSGAIPTITVPVSRLVSNRESIVVKKHEESSPLLKVPMKAVSTKPSIKVTRPDSNLLGGNIATKSKPGDDLPSSFIFDVVKTDYITAKTSKPTEDSQVNFFALPDKAVNSNIPSSPPQKLKLPMRDSVNNPYINRMSNQFSIPRVMDGSVQIRDSRVSQMLMAIGGYGTSSEFDLKQDFMNMSMNPIVVNQLFNLGDEIEPQNCYSDTIFLFDKNFKKSKFLVFISNYAISFFNTKKTKLLKLYLLKSIKGVTISATNFTLSVLSFSNQADLLIESYRRLELICYLNHMVKLAELPKFTLAVRKRFIIKSDNKQTVPDKIEVTDPNLKMNLSFLQDTFRNSKKSGFLKKHSKQWYGGVAIKTYFCLLCNIGLIYFKNYGVDAFNLRTTDHMDFSLYLVLQLFELKTRTQRRGVHLSSNTGMR